MYSTYADNVAYVSFETFKASPLVISHVQDLLCNFPCEAFSEWISDRKRDMTTEVDSNIRSNCKKNCLSNGLLDRYWISVIISEGRHLGSQTKILPLFFSLPQNQENGLKTFISWSIFTKKDT